MRTTEKKEYMVVLIILLLAVATGFFMSSRHSRLVMKYPDQQAKLTEDDFSIITARGVLKVGSSSFAEVTRLYPQGKTLGMSTVYAPENSGCLFTFSKKENILIKIHIDSSEVSTFRHITVNQPFTKVVTAYGNNFARVSQQNDTDNFDAVYGSDDSIVFQVRDNMVKKIIVQKEVR
ncbi:MAG: hypothetical protein ACOX6I_08400 [Syntrophomonadaceae bacterium]